MSKRKLVHLKELSTFPNVFQLQKEMKGKWNDHVFKNNNPITLELACGKGEYAIALAKKFPERNFIGIDIKGARMWRGAKTALEENIFNVVFLRTYIDHITEYFSEHEVEEIWITFPDPYHENSKARKRLTSEMFLKRYLQILKPNGVIHLKTDDLFLYQFTLEMIEQFNCHLLFYTRDLYHENQWDEIMTVKTFYERQHLANGKTIKYLSFNFDGANFR